MAKEKDTTTQPAGGGSPADTKATAQAASATGTQILTAPTREALFQKVEEQKATLGEGQTLIAGAAARTEDGTYTIQVDII